MSPLDTIGVALIGAGIMMTIMALVLTLVEIRWP
jgi:hypothetical protein